MIWLRSKWTWAVAATLVAATIWFAARGGGETDGFLTGTVEKGLIRTTISATGTLQALLTVQVGSQVTGRVQSLHADFNSMVRAGQIIARIDPATFDATLVRAQADLEDSRAGLTTAKAGLVNMKASLEAARVALADAERVHRRSNELAEQGVASERDLESALATFEQARARHRQAEAQVESAAAAIEQASARIRQSAASVKLAEVNLDYTIITSPVDGVVVSRNVDVGQTVSASLQAPTLFIIANDLTRMQVVASVDEADIGSIGSESKVTFSVDSFPGESFPGTINQIRLNPVVTQNVVTYSVIVMVGNPDLKLRPGMTANTTFTVAESADALRLPNAALRFWPGDVSREREREFLAEARAEGDRPTAGAPPAQVPANGSFEGIQRGSEVLRFPTISRPRWRPRIIWVRGEDGRPAHRVVLAGITDGTATEIREGVINAGDTVILGSSLMSATSARPTNPFVSPMTPRAGGGGRRP